MFYHLYLHLFIHLVIHILLLLHFTSLLVAFARDYQELAKMFSYSSNV